MQHKTHTVEKPITSRACDKKFAQKSQLVKHQATHSYVKSFKCSFCPEGRYFKTKFQLSQHMVLHYKPKFAGSHCDYKSHKKCNLYRHLKTHQKKKTTNILLKLYYL